MVRRVGACVASREGTCVEANGLEERGVGRVKGGEFLPLEMHKLTPLRYTVEE